MYVQTHEKDEMQCLKRKKKRQAKKRKEKEKENEWGTKCLDQFCEIKWATQWKLRVEKCTK